MAHCGDGVLDTGETCDGCETNCVRTPTTLAAGQGGPRGITVDSTHAYWTNNGTDEVMKVPLGGGTPVALAAGQNAPYGITVDSTHAYWTNYDAGEVMKVPK